MADNGTTSVLFLRMFSKHLILFETFKKRPKIISRLEEAVVSNLVKSETFTKN